MKRAWNACKIKKLEKKKKTKAIEELNWKHEEVIPEADGPTITPDRNWNPERPQDQEQTNNVEQINEHIRFRTQDPKLRAQEEEKDKEEVKELHEQMKQMQLLEAQGKLYDPEEALRQRPNKTGQNPMDIVRTVRIVEGTEDQEIPAW